MRGRFAILLAALAGPGPLPAASYPLPPPGESLVGELAYETTAYEDTLVDLARRHRLGYEELVLANPAVDRWLPGAGSTVMLPTRFVLPPGPREGIVVNLAEFRLYYYPTPSSAGAPRTVETFAVSAGREDWQTPQRRTHIALKLENPAWYPPRSIRDEHAADGRPLPAVVPPGPDNPLGPRALKLAIPGGYFIHGTIKPFGIGMRVTHGCLRLYSEDMETLFARVPKGTPVRVIDEPYKAGWSDGVLYLEAHPPKDTGRAGVIDVDGASARLEAAARHLPAYRVDRAWVESLLLQPRGVPLPVRPEVSGRS